MSLLVDPEHEEIHRSNLGHLVVGTVQPKDLKPSQQNWSQAPTLLVAKTEPQYAVWETAHMKPDGDHFPRLPALMGHMLWD